MKKILVTTTFVLGLVFSAFSQADSMYVVKGDSVISAYATSEVDSIIFYRPTKTATCAQIGEFRDGGIVFWVDSTDCSKGLVVGIVDLHETTTIFQETAAWGCNNQTLSGATGTAIGTGAQNTLDILAGCAVGGTPATPAQLCSYYTQGGFNDWFLPSKDEINEIHINFAAINAALPLANGGETISIDNYWTSSQSSVHAEAFAHTFRYGVQESISKIYEYRVRAIRAF